MVIWFLLFNCSLKINEMNIIIKFYNIVIIYKWYFCFLIDLRFKLINLRFKVYKIKEM